MKAGSFVAVIIMGNLLRRAGFFKEEDFYVLSKIVLKITLPAAIISNFSGIDLKPSMLVVTLLGFAGGILYIAVDVYKRQVMEDIRHSIAQQRAVIREPGFEPEQFYRMDAQMHSIWFAAVRRQKLWEMLQAQQLHYTCLLYTSRCV